MELKFFQNDVTITGRMVREPITKQLSSGKRINAFSIATPLYRDNNGKWETGYFNVVAWDQLAGDVSLYISQGEKITVKGRLNYRRYQTQNGEWKSITEIIAKDIFINDDLKKLKDMQEEEQEETEKTREEKIKELRNQGYFNK